MENTRKLVEYGIKPKPRDTHLTLCNGFRCSREDCPQGKKWRKAHNYTIVERDGVPHCVQIRAE